MIAGHRGSGCRDDLSKTIFVSGIVSKILLRLFLSQQETQDEQAAHDQEHGCWGGIPQKGGAYLPITCAISACSSIRNICLQATSLRLVILAGSSPLASNPGVPKVKSLRTLGRTSIASCIFQFDERRLRRGLNESRALSSGFLPTCLFVKAVLKTRGDCSVNPERRLRELRNRQVKTCRNLWREAVGGPDRSS
jgi:hypothetical protein